MEVKYDKEAQALYIKVSDVPSSLVVVDHSKELGDNVLIDYLPSGEVYGIEILGVEGIKEQLE